MNSDPMRVDGGLIIQPAPEKKRVPMYEEETVLLPKAVAKRVTEEYDLCPYHDRMTRSEYIGLLIESALENERRLRDQKEARSALVVQAPAGLDLKEVAERLALAKKGL
jgi:hypothetical protein